MRAILAGLIVFAGILCFALAVFAWVPQWLGIPLLGAVAILLCLVVLRMFNGPTDLFGEGANRRPRTQRFENRMLRPKFAELEERLEFELPESLKQLYADPDRVLREFFEVVGKDGQTWEFQGFLPADPGSLSNARIAKVDGFAFAYDVEAQVFYLPRPTLDLPPPVLLRKFSGEDLLVAASFDEFASFAVRDIAEDEED